MDSDIILDMFFERYPFSEYTKLLLIECKNRDIKVSTSAIVIANLNYILSKKLGKTETREKIKELIKWLNILSVESMAIEKGLNSNFSDLEDAFQHFTAERFECQAIITRNIKDYKHATLPVLSAEQFLRSI
ncbi:PIN domain-containing protein [Mucilaginibacter sp. JRF]|uniref:type II toxin-antitoxin system VapC family toxin n=1 Tax=Mucilaginibacter sp. JRF TaxID=2780088 RepID=UPI00187EA8D2|nr:PIN domain-containing protein [Mucilaginibacter sp. JRF]MBE9586541.1 PIN domain-containing protein [Mucilaginibacter sp. JRF]